MGYSVYALLAITVSEMPYKYLHKFYFESAVNPMSTEATRYFNANVGLKGDKKTIGLNVSESIVMTDTYAEAIGLEDSDIVSAKHEIQKEHYPCIP